SCSVPVGGVEGRSITTLEGLSAPDGTLHDVQQAFIYCPAAHCGYCLNGMIVSTVALLAREPHPSDAQARDALSHNLCRCGTHLEILDAVRRAVMLLAGTPETRVPAAPTSRARGATFVKRRVCCWSRATR